MLKLLVRYHYAPRFTLFVYTLTESYKPPSFLSLPLEIYTSSPSLVTTRFCEQTNTV